MRSFHVSFFKKMRKKFLIPIVLVLFVAIALYITLPYLRPKDNYLTVSGRIEATEIELAARIPGRLSNVFIDDGTVVRKGDTIASIEDEELQSKRKEVMRSIEEVMERINAAEFNLNYTVNNVEHTIDEAKKALDVTEARLRQAEATRENAEKEFKRYSSLLQNGAVSEQRYDNVRLSYMLSQEEVNSASKEVDRAKVSLLKAEDSRELIKAKEKELLALRKSLTQLKEVLKQVEINLGYAKITAPLDGIILRKVSEPGEVIPQGGVVGVMINLEDIYAKTYVPEKYIGRIHINMKADVFTDAYPNRPFTGSICYISDKAEFTPKEVQSYEERIKQVFAVKVCFPGEKSTDKKTYEVLKKGMPVDVRFPVRAD